MCELMLTTWSWGTLANAAGMPILTAGGDALDAVVAGATAVEDEESVDSVGVGGMPDFEGHVSLDACVMTAPHRCGAVAGIRGYPHPTAIARRVMERTNHILLVGDGAAQFATREGFEQRELLTEPTRAKWQAWRAHLDAAGYPPYSGWHPPRNVEEPDKFPAPPSAKRGEPPTHDTVGLLARDSAGTLAGACSTSGMALKVPGRVGDSPILGHGLYVDQRVGAAVATGNGELIMGVCAAFLAVELMRRDSAPEDACVGVLRRVAECYELRGDEQVALIAIASAANGGHWAGAALRPGFSYVVSDASGTRRADPHFVLLPD